MLLKKEVGDSKNPTLVFLHGFLGSHLDFKALVEKLSSCFFCILLDLPGHGESKKISFKDYPSFEKKIIKALQSYKKFSIVAYSMGGRIAGQLFSKIPFESLILISSNFEPLSVKGRASRKRLDTKQCLQLQKDSFLNFLTQWYSQPLFCSLKKNVALYRQMIENRIDQDPKALANVLKILSPASMPAPSYFLSHYDKPLLLLAGSLDQKYQSLMSRAHQRFPKAWLVECNETSHALHLEDPLLVSNYIKNFHRYYHGRMERKTSV